MKYFLTVFFFILLFYSFGQNSTLIKAGKFYNSQTNTFQKNIQILITNENVAKVGTNLIVPADTKIIECTNCTVTPGLIDMHTHFLYRENSYAKSVIEDGINNTDADRSLRAIKICRNYLAGGITSVRDLGNSGEYLDVSLRNGINAGYFPGPAMFVSGPIISPFGGQTYNLPFHSQHLTDKEYRVVKNADDARLAVKEHIKMGVDLIKICADNSPGNLLLSFEEIKAITETAHEYDLKVTAHATFDKSVRRAILAGADGIEHGYDISDSTLDLMKKRNIYLVPTDLTYQGAINIFKLENRSIDTNYVRSVINSFKERLQRAVKKQVTLVFGRDYYFDIPYSESDAAKDALLSYFEAGIQPKDVLRSATQNAAMALGKKDKLGVIKEGAVADIVLFDGDLETDFSKALFKVKTVLKNGKIVQ